MKYQIILADCCWEYQNFSEAKNRADIAKNNKIYGLYEPGTNEIRYIGITNSPLCERKARHIYDVKNDKTRCKVRKWIRNLLLENKKPDIQLLQDNAIKNDEIQWIQAYYFIGYDLLNQTIGGPGSYGYTHDNIGKSKISQKAKERTGSKNSFFNKKHTDKAKKQMSIKHKNKEHYWFNKKVICLDTGEIFDSIKKAAINKNINYKSISNVCKGKQKTGGGFRWSYYNE